MQTLRNQTPGGTSNDQVIMLTPAQLEQLGISVRVLSTSNDGAAGGVSNSVSVSLEQVDSSKMVGGFNGGGVASQSQTVELLDMNRLHSSSTPSVANIQPATDQSGSATQACSSIDLLSQAFAYATGIPMNELNYLSPQVAKLIRESPRKLSPMVVCQRFVPPSPGFANIEATTSSSPFRLPVSDNSTAELIRCKEEQYGTAASFHSPGVVTVSTASQNFPRVCKKEPIYVDDSSSGLTACAQLPSNCPVLSQSPGGGGLVSFQSPGGAMALVQTAGECPVSFSSQATVLLQSPGVGRVVSCLASLPSVCAKTECPVLAQDADIVVSGFRDNMFRNPESFASGTALLVTWKKEPIESSDVDESRTQNEECPLFGDNRPELPVIGTLLVTWKDEPIETSDGGNDTSQSPDVGGVADAVSDCGTYDAQSTVSQASAIASSKEFEWDQENIKIASMTMSDQLSPYVARCPVGESEESMGVLETPKKYRCTDDVPEVSVCIIAAPVASSSGFTSTSFVSRCLVALDESTCDGVRSDAVNIDHPEVVALNESMWDSVRSNTVNVQPSTTVALDATICGGGRSDLVNSEPLEMVTLDVSLCDNILSDAINIKPHEAVALDKITCDDIRSGDCPVNIENDGICRGDCPVNFEGDGIRSGDCPVNIEGDDVNRGESSNNIQEDDTGRGDSSVIIQSDGIRGGDCPIIIAVNGIRKGNSPVNEVIIEILVAEEALAPVSVFCDADNMSTPPKTSASGSFHVSSRTLRSSREKKVVTNASSPVRYILPSKRVLDPPTSSVSPFLPKPPKKKKKILVRGSPQAIAPKPCRSPVKQAAASIRAKAKKLFEGGGVQRRGPRPIRPKPSVRSALDLDRFAPPQNATRGTGLGRAVCNSGVVRLSEGGLYKGLNRDVYSEEDDEDLADVYEEEEYIEREGGAIRGGGVSDSPNEEEEEDNEEMRPTETFEMSRPPLR